MMPATASTVESTASHGVNSGCSTAGKAKVGSTKCSKRVVAHEGALNQAGRFVKPRKMAAIARIHSGMVMTFGDSCGVPWPRYSPQKVIQ